MSETMNVSDPGPPGIQVAGPGRPGRRGIRVGPASVGRLPSLPPPYAGMCCQYCQHYCGCRPAAAGRPASAVVSTGLYRLYQQRCLLSAARLVLEVERLLQCQTCRVHSVSVSGPGHGGALIMRTHLANQFYQKLQELHALMRPLCRILEAQWPDRHRA
jgi:hypothetical protein